MNALRTIQENEKQIFIDDCFRHVNQSFPGPKKPLEYPFSGVPRQTSPGEFLYIVYRSEIIGYGVIDRVEKGYSNTKIGSESRSISKGGTIVLKGHLTKMPFEIKGIKGFMGIRYCDIPLHQTIKQKAVEEIRKVLKFL